MELQESKEISLGEAVAVVKNWVSFLLGKWWILMICAGIGAGLGLAYASYKKPVYLAKCTFVLQEESGGGMSQYAGLASIVGIDMAGGAGSGLFKASNIVGLYKSRLMLEKTLLSAVDFNGKKDLLINRYFSASKMPRPELNFGLPRNRYTVKHDSVVKVVVEDIRRNYLKIENSDESPNIMIIQMTSRDELFAKEFTDKMVENVNAFYTETMTSKSQRNVNTLEKQADSVRSVLNRAIRGSASAMDANPNPNLALRILQVPSQRSQVDVQAASAIYAETMKNLEVAKMALRNETPLIQIVDRPVLPLDVIKINKLVGMIVGAFGLLLISVIFLLFKKIIAS